MYLNESLSTDASKETLIEALGKMSKSIQTVIGKYPLFLRAKPDQITPALREVAKVTKENDFAAKIH
jgi:hypothetical protein